MKYQKSFLSLCLLLLCGASLALAQQPTKIKRPVKNPPQYPNIIDVDNKDAASKPAQTANQDSAAQTAPIAQPDALVQAVNSLVGEMRSLSLELRALNLRQQVELELLRVSRTDLRVDHYERELQPVRTRITALEAEEQNLYQLMTRESLLAQSSTMATVNREQTMAQLRQNYEIRLRAVLAEKERLNKLEGDLNASRSIYQGLTNDAERRMQEAEELLKQLENSRPPAAKPDSGKTERKP